MPRCLRLAPDQPEAALMQEAVRVLRRGEIVACPTDTVYGLAVDAMNTDAVSRLFAVKGRCTTKAIPLIIGDLSQLSQVADTVPSQAEILIATFWPGPLTLLFKPRVDLPEALRGSSPQIGVRCPAAVISQYLANGLGRPITATSANRAGAPAALNAAEVMAQLGADIDLVLDGGAASSADVSTVLDVTTSPPRVLRTGKITLAAIEEVLGYPIV
jgi:L-threonylcarbamoyladenylate synthase